MNTLSIFLSRLYIKYFFLLFISLELFFVGIDFMYNYELLIDSANIKVIYLAYSFVSASSLIVPLSIVLTIIVLSFRLIKSSELVALYAIGYSKKSIIKPIFILSIFISSFFVSINFTELAYAKDNMDNILKNHTLTSIKDNIFLKNYNQYIYFKKLLPIEQKAIDVKIFTIDNGNVVSVIYAKEAKFIDDKWEIKNATIYNNPQQIDFKSGKLEITQVAQMYTLSGFKPTILDNVYDSKIQLSITDAISAISLLNNQHMDTSKIRGALYSFLIYPFFASFLLIIIFYFMPISNRLSNILYFNSIAIFCVLMVWGGLYSLVRFASFGTINPEIAIILPILFISFASMYYYKKL